jgi:Flp pilus assembly pilin Flp
MLTLRKAKKGQGVVEYAGALVIAVAVVAAVIGIGPTAIQSAFQTVIDSVAGGLAPPA